jgi:hypothetical protein
VLLYGGISLGVLLLLAAPFIVMGVVKGARRALATGRPGDDGGPQVDGRVDEFVPAA